MINNNNYNNNYNVNKKNDILDENINLEIDNLDKPKTGIYLNDLIPKLMNTISFLIDSNEQINISTIESSSTILNNQNNFDDNENNCDNIYNSKINNIIYSSINNLKNNTLRVGIIYE